ncbi:MAG TPA: methyltransferase [Kofleriaceae bacterium]
MITQRALAAWAGIDRISALDPVRLAALPVTRASAELARFVAGVDVPLAWIAPELAELSQACVAILPTARGVIVCDRHDAADSPDRVCWPDDSSYHLARSIPAGRRASWLDLGCGSAFAMLERPELAERLVAVDVNPRAADFARRGAALSGVDRLEVIEADATTFDPGERFELVTCNPPIPGGGGPIWRGASTEIVRRMVANAGRLVAPGGLVVVHAALDVLADLPGDSTVVAYTPDGTQAFGVAWWSPGGEPRQILTRRVLTTDRPHIDHSDRQAALAGELRF